MSDSCEIRCGHAGCDTVSPDPFRRQGWRVSGWTPPEQPTFRCPVHRQDWDTDDELLLSVFKKLLRNEEVYKGPLNTPYLTIDGGTDLMEVEVGAVERFLNRAPDDA